MRAVCWASLEGNRSGRQDIALASTTADGVPSRHGHACRVPTGPLGTAPTCTPSLSGGPRSARGGLGRPGAGVADAAPPDVAACFTAAIAPPPASPSASPSGAAPSWGTTRAAGPSAPATPGARSGGGRGPQASAGFERPRVLRGRGSHPGAAGRDRAATAPAGRARLSRASAGVPRLRRGDARPLARRGAPGHRRATGPRHAGVVSGGLAAA
jgi:hypothetical protein